jgi:hypothetical protein
MDPIRRLQLVETGGLETFWLVYSPFQQLLSSQVSLIPHFKLNIQLTRILDIGGQPLAYPSTILACISFVLVIAVYVIYWKGPVLRKRSPFAQQLSDARTESDVPGRRLSRIPSRQSAIRAHSFSRSQQELRVRQTMGSRKSSMAGPSKNKTPQRTPMASRNNSYAAPMHHGHVEV